MSRIESVSPLQPSGIKVIEDGKKVSPLVAEEVVAAFTKFQMSVQELEQKTAIGALSEPQKTLLIKTTDGIEETLNSLLKDPSPYKDQEVEIMRKMVLFLSEQRALNETTEQIHLSEILFQQKRQTQLNNEYFNRKKELSELTKVAKGFEVASVVTGLVVVGCTLFTLATGGAGAALSVVAGGAALGNGISTVGKSIFDFQKDKKSGELFSLAAEREEITTDISDNMESVSDAVKGVMQTWSDLRELIASRLEASKNF